MTTEELKQTLAEHVNVNVRVTGFHFKTDDMGNIAGCHIEVITSLEWDGKVMATNVCHSELETFEVRQHFSDYVAGIWRAIHGLEKADYRGL